MRWQDVKVQIDKVADSLIDKPYVKQKGLATSEHVSAYKALHSVCLLSIVFLFMGYPVNYIHNNVLRI